MEKKDQERYSAKLLFQFRVMVGGHPYKRRLCEERIVHFRAASAREALRMAKKRGRDAQHDFVNDEGNQVYVDFVGVMDLLCLCGIACDPDEVWYEIKQHLKPMERRDRFIPAEDKLCAIVNEQKERGPSGKKGVK